MGTGAGGPTSEPGVRQEPDIVGVVALLVAALVLGSACGGPGDDPAERSPDTRAPVGAAELAGRTFVSTGVTEQGEPRPLVADTRISIEFEGATVRWDAGCNLFGAAYRIDAGRLVFTEGYGGTAMGCLPQPRADQDEWLASLMAAEPGLALGRDTLTVSSDHTVIVLVDEDSATTDAELVGTTWTLDTIVEGDTASSVPTGVSATLVFGADGSVVGTDDCNGYGGRYSVEGDVLVVVPAEDSTAPRCSEAGRLVESAGRATLAGEVGWAIEGDRLTLEGPDGHGLVYRADG